VDEDGDGYIAVEKGGEDCNDQDPSIHPGADERCDGVDNNCDGELDGPDSVDAVVSYVDADGDGFGAEQDELERCPDSEGFSTVDGDCDDADAQRFPGALDRGLEDRNCDGWYPGTRSTGPQHFCGIKDGSVRCYGRDNSGQVSDAPSGEFVQVSAGGQSNTANNHSCALDESGAISCWGDDEYEQVSGAPESGTYQWVATGNLHTCALGTDRTPTCWGDASAGALMVPEALELETLEVGGFHSCGLESTGTVRCWGLDNFEQVSQPDGVIAEKVVTGQYHTCVLQDGGISCWGYDTVKQVTDTPTATDFVDLVAGGYHNCGQHADGTLTCWGKSDEGQSTPPEGVRLTALIARDEQTCGLDEQGFLRCWGLNDYGQAPRCLGSLWPDVDEPQNLSDIGLYADVATHQLADSIKEYAPRFSLWSDGSEKGRWVYLPECASIDNSDENGWKFPVGTRLYKEFKVDDKRVETRMIEFMTPDGDNAYDDGVLYVAYLWNADESEATLWDPDAGTNNAAAYAAGFTHDVPSRFQCQQCHGGTGLGGVPSRVLGFSAIQLTGTDGVNMASLSDGGWLTHPNVDGVPVPGDATAQAALGTLHANCGNCHNALGEGVYIPGGFDLMLSVGATDVTETGTWQTAVDVQSTRYLAVPMRILAGDPENSSVYVRMKHRAADPVDGLEFPQMPPLGTKIQDVTGLSDVEAWILSLE